MNESEAVEMLMKEFKNVSQHVIDRSFQKTMIPCYTENSSIEFSQEQIDEMLDEESNDRQLSLDIEKLVTMTFYYQNYNFLL